MTSDNTYPYATSASAHCNAPASAAALDTAFILTQQLDDTKSQFADVFTEPSGLPPDRGIEHVIPFEPDARPACKHLYRLSPSELTDHTHEVKRQVTELLHRQLIEPSVRPYGAPLLLELQKGVSCAW